MEFCIIFYLEYSYSTFILFQQTNWPQRTVAGDRQLKFREQLCLQLIENFSSRKIFNKSIKENCTAYEKEPEKICKPIHTILKTVKLRLCVILCNQTIIITDSGFKK